MANLAALPGRPPFPRATAARQRKFEFPVKWGVDLQSEHECYLTEKYAKKPVIVVNYPKAIKAFYMRLNDTATPSPPP